MLLAEHIASRPSDPYNWACGHRHRTPEAAAKCTAKIKRAIAKKHVEAEAKAQASACPTCGHIPGRFVIGG